VRTQRKRVQEATVDIFHDVALQGVGQKRLVHTCIRTNG
jgi:hypothetical protein